MKSHYDNHIPLHLLYMIATTIPSGNPVTHDLASAEQWPVILHYNKHLFSFTPAIGLAREEW